MNFVNDIVTSYKDDLRIGRKEQFSERDLMEGAKIVFAAVGLAKLVISLGAIAVGLFGAVISFAMNNPQTAIRIGQMISKNRDSIAETIRDCSKKLDSTYSSLDDTKKKYVRAAVLFVAKGGISWSDLK